MLWGDFSGCQRDDICPETTQTTPKLVIEFRDFENPSEPKTVPNLNVRAIGEEESYFENAVSDTLVTIPLQTSENLTIYELTIHSNLIEDDEEGNDDEENNEDDDLEPNTDRINFSYATEEVYLGRACGYKVEFIEFSADVIGEGNEENWIENVEVQQPNDIVDETTTHLYIYH